MNIIFDIPKPNLETVKQINDLYLRTWLKTYPNKEKNITEDLIKKFFAKFDTQESYNKKIENLKNTPKDKKYIIAKDGDKIIGVCTAKITNDVNELVSIYIDPKYQEKGIGNKLWLELQSFFDPKKDIIVRVVDYNEKAIKFYESLGFVDSGRRISNKRFTFENGANFLEIEMIKKH